MVDHEWKAKSELMQRMRKEEAIEQERYNKAALDVLTRFRQSRELPTNSLVYHYTNARGLLGILERKVLWATDARHLNDSQELVYFTSILRNVLDEELDGSSDVFFTDDEPRVFNEDVFVASFSEDPDVLSQWRAYASDGAGYAVGIRIDVPLVAADLPVDLLPVIYDPVQQKQLIAEVVHRVLEHERPESPRQLGAIERRCSRALAILAPLLKNPGFREEQEWRVVLPYRAIRWVQGRKVNFRESRFGVTPYVEVTSADGGLPIAEVWLGPKLNNESNAEITSFLLAKYGIDEKQGELVVQRSETSYR